MNFIKNFVVSTFYVFSICLIQISIFNHPIFLGVYSYVYIIFILIYPYKWNKYIFLFFSFLIGFIIDCFMNTGGTHAFSTTLSAYLRNNFLKFFDGNNFNQQNFSIYNLSFLKKIFYIFSLVIIHDISLLMIELLNGSVVISKIIFFKILFSSVFTTILCIIYFFLRKTKN
ncbi:rod shape-determining protein MreD [Blattabacterium cuenoti]|uniref:rod shape-determining protein MreD n=1 Tax=Blattabacterium cuenoti TaxID=1653831 RepID=UPI00163BBA30|nr:rod shape-determining protein MreD [Blattabacterium cuenoti]